LVAAVLGLAPAHAAIDRTEIGQVEAAPLPGAALPLDLQLRDEAGETRRLRDWLGATPSLWIIADYTCETLCGPVISIAADALAASALKPGADFRLIVVGLDPKDTAADAAAMKRAQVGARGGVADASYFLRADAAEIGELTRAFGFHASYDREHDQFAHPAAAFAVTANGRVARALSGLALDGASVRLALVDAGRGRVGSFTDHVRLLCYGFDPASGIYTLAVRRLLFGTGLVTIAALAVLIAFLLRRERAMRPG
jgi:protein SCO1/2